MKRIILVTIIVGSFLAVNAAGQRGRGPMSGAGVGSGVRVHGPLPPVRPIPPQNPFRPGASYPRLGTDGYRGRGFRQAPYGAFGAPVWDYSSYFSGFGYAGDYASYEPGSNETPSVVVLMPQMPFPPPPPPPPAEPVIHEYKWPDTSSHPGATFSVALRGGQARTAVAGWVQDGFLSLVTPDGRAKQIPLEAIDRNVTQRLNAKNSLTLCLPPVVEP
jgi:hypothetical protein